VPGAKNLKHSEERKNREEQPTDSLGAKNAVQTKGVRRDDAGQQTDNYTKIGSVHLIESSNGAGRSNSGQIMSTNQTLLSLPQTDRLRYSARSGNISNLSDSFRPLPFHFPFSTCQTISKNEKAMEKCKALEYTQRDKDIEPCHVRKNVINGKTSGVLHWIFGVILVYLESWQRKA